MFRTLFERLDGRFEQARRTAHRSGTWPRKYNEDSMYALDDDFGPGFEDDEQTGRRDPTPIRETGRSQTYPSSGASRQERRSEERRQDRQRRPKVRNQSGDVRERTMFVDALRKQMRDNVRQTSLRTYYQRYGGEQDRIGPQRRATWENSRRGGDAKRPSAARRGTKQPHRGASSSFTSSTSRDDSQGSGQANGDSHGSHRELKCPAGCVVQPCRHNRRRGRNPRTSDERKPLGEDKPAKTGGAKGSRRRSGPHSQQKGPPPTREGNTSSTRQEQGSPPRRKRKETARVPPFPKDFPFDPFPFFSGSGTPSPFDGFGRYRNSRARGEYGTRNPKGPRRGNRNDDWTGNIYDSCEDSYEQVSLPDGPGIERGQDTDEPAGLRDMRSHYEVLGVEWDVTPQEIKLVAKKLVIENHPDKVQGRGGSEEERKKADEEVRKINGAKEVLLDKVKRREHDVELAFGTWAGI